MKNLAFAIALIPLMITACAPTQAVRGNIIEDHRLAQVQVGVDTQSEVLRKLGSPTTKAPFDDSIWYYMGQKTEKRGILDPEITEERIMEARFDEQGTLLSLRDVGKGRTDVPYVRRKTPTSGNEVTMMEQLVGNLGKFNKSQGGSATTTAGGAGDGL